MHRHGGGGAHPSTALRAPWVPPTPTRSGVARSWQLRARREARRGDRDATAGTTTQALAEAEPSSPGPRRHERAAARRTPGAVARPRRPVMGSCVSRGEDPAARDAARGGGTSTRPRGRPGWVSALHGPVAPQGTRAPLGPGSAGERAACRARSGRRSPHPTPHSAPGRWHEARSPVPCFLPCSHTPPAVCLGREGGFRFFWSSYGPLSSRKIADLAPAPQDAGLPSPGSRSLPVPLSSALETPWGVRRDEQVIKVGFAPPSSLTPSPPPSLPRGQEWREDS